MHVADTHHISHGSQCQFSWDISVCLNSGEEQEMAMKYRSEIPAVLTEELGKKQSWCFTGISNNRYPSTRWRGAAGFGGLVPVHRLGSAGS